MVFQHLDWIEKESLVSEIWNQSSLAGRVFHPWAVWTGPRLEACQVRDQELHAGFTSDKSAAQDIFSKVALLECTVSNS